MMTIVRSGRGLAIQTIDLRNNECAVADGKYSKPGDIRNGWR